MSDNHPHDGDNGELPPWLRDDPPPEAKKPPTPSGSELPAFPGIPASPEDEAIPPWLRDDKLTKVNRFGEEDWLAAADMLPQSLDTGQTYDDWAAIQKELQREKGIEEEVPDLSTALPDEPPKATTKTGPLGQTGELPDWFLGLEELDTTDAPDWFTGESASAFRDEPEEELPPPQDSNVHPDSISSFFESLHEAPVYHEPDPNNPFAIRNDDSNTDQHEEELPSLDWVSSQPYAPEAAPDDSYTGTEMDAFFRSLSSSTARVVTGELKLPPDQTFDEPPPDSTQPVEAVFSDGQPAEELPDVDWFGAVGVTSAAAEIEEPELDLIMTDSSAASTQFLETRLELDEPAEADPEEAISGETMDWLSELENIVTSVNRPLDDEEPLPAAPDFSTLEAFNFASEGIADPLAESPVYDWEAAVEASIPDPEEAQESEVVINPEGVVGIKTDWLKAINPEAMEAAQAAAETLPEADEPAWESPLLPVDPGIKLTGMLTRAGIHEAPEEPEPDFFASQSEDDAGIFGDLSWDEVVNSPSAADQIPEPVGFDEESLNSVLLAETLMGGEGLDSDFGFEAAADESSLESADADWNAEIAAPDLDWLSGAQLEDNEPDTVFAEEEALIAEPPVETAPDSDELDWLAAMQAGGDLTVDAPALAQEANADLAAFERALFGDNSPPADHSTGEETGWMSDELFGEAEPVSAMGEQELESLGLESFDIGEPDAALDVDQDAASELARELSELAPSDLEDDLFADVELEELLAGDYDAATLSELEAEFTPTVEADVSEYESLLDTGFAETLSGGEAEPEFELDLSAFESESYQDFTAKEILADDFEIDLEGFETEQGMEETLFSDAEEAFESGELSFENPVSASELLAFPQGDVTLEETAADLFAFEQPDAAGDAWASDIAESFSAPDFVEHEMALSEDDDDDRIDDEQFYPDLEALPDEAVTFGPEQEILADEAEPDLEWPAEEAAASALDTTAEQLDDGFVIHFGGDAFAEAHAEAGLESDENAPTLEEFVSGEAVFDDENSEDDFYRSFGLAQEESGAQAESLPYEEGIPGSFSWEVNAYDEPPLEDDFEFTASTDQVEPDFVAKIEQYDADEVVEPADDEAQFEDLDSYLKTLTTGTGVLKPVTDSLLEPDADLESLLEQKVTEDAPAPQGYNPYGVASPFDISDDPELADLAAAETPDWLADVSVGEISATAIVRKQQDRSEGDLDERLKKLRSRAEKIPQQTAATETDSLETVLPGVGSAIAPARIGISSSGVGEVMLTPDQQKQLALLTSLVATATDTAEQDSGKRASAIDQTYEFAHNLDFDEEHSATAAKAPVKAAPKKRKAGGRQRIRIDRLLIALLMLAVISLPFFLREARVGEPPAASFAGDPRAIAAFNVIENLAPGSVVLVGAEYASAAAAELDMALEAILRHILLRGAYPVVLSANPLGLLRAELLLDEIAGDSDFLAQFGASELLPNADYFLVQFVPGGAIGLRAFSEDTAQLVQNDIRGQVTGLNLTTLRDFAAVAVVSDRIDDVRAYVEQIAPLTGSPMIALVNYSAAPMVEPYVDGLPGSMLAGLISGYEGAYAYNTLIGNFPEPRSGLAALLMPETTVGAEVTAEIAGTPFPTSAAQFVPRENRPAPLLFTPSATFTPTPTFTPTHTPTFTPTHTLTPTLTPTPVQGSISSNQAVNLRAQPDTTAEVLARLQPGTTVTVIGVNEDGSWFNVRLDDGLEGWVSSQLIAISGVYHLTGKDTVAKPAKQTLPDEPTPTADFDSGELTATAQVNAFALTATALVQAIQSTEDTQTGEAAATNTPAPTATNTRRPTSTPEPTETNTRRPSATAEPTATPTEEVTEEVTTPEATEQLAPPISFTVLPPSAGYRDERWYALTLGILVSAGVIALGAIINIARGISRRRRAR